jgi:hypothetical protein
MITGGSTIRPTHGPRDPTGSRENPVADIGGVASDWGGTVPSNGVALHLRYHVGAVMRQAAPCWAARDLQNAMTATDEPRAARPGAAQQQRQFPLTSH